MHSVKRVQIVAKRFSEISSDKPLSIANDETSKKRVIFTRSIKPKYGAIKFNIKTSGDSVKFILLNKRFRHVQLLANNAETLVSNLDNSRYYLAIVIPPGKKTEISKLGVDHSVDLNTYREDLLDKFKGDTLLIAPGYPSPDDLYNHAFIHTRAKQYRDHGIKSVDIAIVNEDFINKTSIYQIDGITVHNIGYNEARLLLQRKKYEKILIHFFNLKYAQILDACDTSSSQIFIYTHGGDVLYKDYQDVARQYFKDKPPITESLKREFEQRDQVLKRYNTYENVHWIFATKWCLKRAEKLLGEIFNRSHVISNPIPTGIFSYRKRDPEDRKKICIVRPFKNLSSYSIDISVRTVLELSSRPFFSDLEINVYGAGELHELLTKPLAGIPNVKIHNRFLDSKSLAKTFQDHGIVLMPTRYDNQAVAACEAAMTGAVIISSDGDIGLKDCVDPSLGTFCETEDFRQYADLIEKLYYDEKKFLDISKKMHAFTYNACGEKQAIEKELSLFKNTRTYSKKLHFEPKAAQPVLTVAVPSYNVEKYLKNGILSLIDHPLAHKLEVLIINDGSKDGTSKIGLELETLSTTKNGPIVRIINKQNGGHGSTINSGIEHATGKYFKLMDGDDYFATEELVKLIHILEEETSDIVLTNYIEDFSIDAFKRPVRHYSFMTPGLQYDLDTMQHQGYGFAEWGPLLSTTTCRTDILKNAGFKIDEHAFYVDMEYNFIVYALSKTVVYYPLDIYNYYLGRDGQSMSRESFARNYLHHEKVTLRLIEEYYLQKDRLSNGKKEYIINKLIVPMCKTQYMICTEYHKKSKPFISFDNKLKNYEDFYNNKEIARRLIKLHRVTRGRLIRFHGHIRSSIERARWISRI